MTPAKGYAKMKDSGIEWVGMIPATWDVFPAGGVFDEVKEKNVNNQYSNPFSFRYGEIVDKIIVGEIDESVEETLSAYRVVSPNTIMINGLNLNYDFISQRVAIVREKGIITSAYLAVQPDEGRIVPRFVLYLLKAYDYRQVFHGVGSGIRKTLKFQDFKSIKIVAPSLTEQTAIAAYLDTQCAKIDEIIAQAKASIEDYKQWKASIIYEAVTKGLDPNVEMKDSGIEWIGKMPKHWQDINPKALFSQRKERANPGDRQLTASQQFGVIYQDEYMEMTGTKVVTVEKDFDILKYVSAGDFVISMRSFQGGLEYSTKSGSISSAYVMLVPNLKLVYPRYYRWLLKSNGYIRALQSTSDLVRDGQAMRYSNFAKVRLITLPLGEQEQIANYLDTQCAKIDKLMTEKQSLIDDLESYKKSLIYEVVTGKRRVC